MMPISRLIATTAAAVVLMALSGFAQRASAETIIVGEIGAGSTVQWPIDIGIEKALFKKRGIDLDVVTTPSNASLEQQLAAGSLNMGSSAGTTDPIRAVAKGAPLVILRIDCQASPYALVSQANVASFKDLKGKIISLDSAKGITRAYFDRVATHFGLKHEDFDYVYQGATPARFAAVKSGAAAAAMLTSPFNFFAEAQGMKSLVIVQDIVKDIPFTVHVANKPWVQSHKELVGKYLDAINEATAWFFDKKNRAEAVQIMLKHTRMKQPDVEKSYDFYHQIDIFNKTTSVSKKHLQNVMNVLVGFGDLDKAFPVENLVLPDITKVMD